MADVWNDGTEVSVRSDDDASTVPLSGRPPEVLIGSEDTGDVCAVVLSIERPGDEPPFHLHEGEDEICYVLEGTLTYYQHAQRVPVDVGRCTFVPRGVEHSFKVQSPQARLLTIYVPGGFEGFVREAGRLSVRALDSYALERLITIAARYGCEITGRPP